MTQKNSTWQASIFIFAIAMLFSTFSFSTPLHQSRLMSPFCLRCMLLSASTSGVFLGQHYFQNRARKSYPSRRKRGSSSEKLLFLESEAKRNPPELHREKLQTPPFDKFVVPSREQGVFVKEGQAQENQELIKSSLEVELKKKDFEDSFKLQIIDSNSIVKFGKYQFNKEKDLIGEGSFGKVYLVKSLIDHKKRALKEVPKDQFSIELVASELQVSSRIHSLGGHPNICAMQDFREDEKNYYFIMPYAKGGELLDRLNEKGPMKEKEASECIKGLIEGLAFLHHAGIVHADIKLENIMLLNGDNLSEGAILIDFGSAFFYEKNDRCPLGTLAYQPLEAIECLMESHKPSLDMWGVGIVLHSILTGSHPFDLRGNADNEEIEENIRNQEGSCISQENRKILSKDAIDLLEKLLDKDPQKRISADEMLQHPWFLQSDQSEAKADICA